MASPADAKAPVAFTHARLSPEEADRLALLFRPSWELDDAPFTGAGTLSEDEMRALGGGGVRPDIRNAAAHAYASNGAHAAPAALEGHAGVDLVAPPTDGQPAAAAPQSQAPSPVLSKATMMGMGAIVLPTSTPGPTIPEPAMAKAPPSARPSQRPPVPHFELGPPTPRPQPVAARPADEPVAYPKKSQAGLWIGLGAAAVVLLGVGVWAITSSGNGDKPVAPAATAETPTQDKLSSVPPPPPPTIAAAPTPPPPPPATTPAVASQAAAPPPPTHIAAAAPPPPPVRQTYVAPPPAPAAHPPPQHKGQTIVRDVPF